jgi:hypothetical protein
MFCYVCSKKLESGYLCEEHVHELYGMLKSGEGMVEEPRPCHHCNICGEYEDRVIIEHYKFGFFCNFDIYEELSRYEKRMSLVEGILDSLKDDGESITQIKEYLDYIGIPYNKKLLKSSLIQLLRESLIKVEFPQDYSLPEVENVSEEEFSNYWFELTDAGIKEWDKIEYE